MYFQLGRGTDTYKTERFYGRPDVDKNKDLYKIKEELWIDDVSKWPTVEIPALYMHFIEISGGYTCENLKADKSLEAYNYYSRAVDIYDSYIYEKFLLQCLGAYSLLL